MFVVSNIPVKITFVLTDVSANSAALGTTSCSVIMVQAQVDNLSDGSPNQSIRNSLLKNIHNHSLGTGTAYQVSALQTTV